MTDQRNLSEVLRSNALDPTTLHPKQLISIVRGSAEKTMAEVEVVVTDGFRHYDPVSRCIEYASPYGGGRGSYNLDEGYFIADGTAYRMWLNAQ